MFQIIGIVLLFGMVFGGYFSPAAISKSSWRHCPMMMTIGGAAMAALLVANSIGE